MNDWESEGPCSYSVRGAFTKIRFLVYRGGMAFQMSYLASLHSQIWAFVGILARSLFLFFMTHRNDRIAKVPVCEVHAPRDSTLSSGPRAFGVVGLLSMRSPGNGFVRVELPQLVRVSSSGVTSPDLKLDTVGVIPVGNVEALVAEQTNLGHWTGVSAGFYCTPVDHPPLFVGSVEVATGGQHHWSAIIVSLCLDARRRACYGRLVTNI